MQLRLPLHFGRRVRHVASMPYLERERDEKDKEKRGDAEPDGKHGVGAGKSERNIEGAQRAGDVAAVARRRGRGCRREALVRSGAPRYLVGRHALLFCRIGEQVYHRIELCLRELRTARVAQELGAYGSAQLRIRAGRALREHRERESACEKRRKSADERTRDEYRHAIRHTVYFS